MVFRDCPSQLVCYKRYIDDLILISEGDMASLELHMGKLNGNNKNISLSWNIDFQHLVFFRKSSKEGTVFLTRNHFKSTDRNA